MLLIFKEDKENEYRITGSVNYSGKRKNISKEVLMEAIEQSLIQACKNHFGKADNVHVTIDHETCEFSVYADKTVVEVVEDPVMEISLSNAKMMDSKYELGISFRFRFSPNSSDVSRHRTQRM